jgi:Fe-S-cluster containining protein
MLGWRAMSERTLRVELSVFGHPVGVALAVPQRAARVDELLPAMYTLADALIDAAVRRLEAQGGSVSCRKGCSACCRAQPVPIAPAEAFALARRVRALPEPRRTELLGRFRDREARLREAGLYELFIRDAPVTEERSAREAASAYLALGLVCPFLEDDACSIHPERPFVCRRYLVSSPAQLCSAPLTNPVEVVPVPGNPAGALLQAAQPVAGRAQLTVPLVLALAWYERHAGELERTTDPGTLLQQWLAALH